MAATKTGIEIEECPVCGELHAYQLKVELGAATFSMNETPPPPTMRSFTMTFRCPTKNQDFQATFRLQESAYGPIKSVRMIGPERG